MSDRLEARILLEMMRGFVSDVTIQRINEEDAYQTVKLCLLQHMETAQDFGSTAPDGSRQVGGPREQRRGGR